eukprot:scaffold9015_cov96-Isochrysis_galbana.AAC.11
MGMACSVFGMLGMLGMLVCSSPGPLPILAARSMAIWGWPVHVHTCSRIDEPTATGGRERGPARTARTDSAWR